MLKALWLTARVLTWALWIGFVLYGVYYMANPSPHHTSLGHLRPVTEAVMFGLPLAAIALGLVQLMIKERLVGSLESNKR